MAYSIKEIEGIGAAGVTKLGKAGITTVEALLKEGATPQDRKALAESTGIDAAKILTWVNMADLFRIRGVASQFAELLVAAGVDTVVELSKRKPENLAAKMREVNDAKKLVRQVPADKVVEGWVKQAKDLKRVVTY